MVTIKYFEDVSTVSGPDTQRNYKNLFLFFILILFFVAQYYTCTNPVRMNKRGRDAQRKGEGLPPNSENADGFESRIIQQLQRTNINAIQNNNNKKNDAKIKDQKFHGTNLPCFFNLVPAEAKLKELNTSRNAKYRMFAFDRNAEGAKMFVIGQLEDFTAICFHRKTSNKFKGYNYEILMDGEPMKLYCDCEYLEADNPGKDKDLVLRSLLYYICQAYQQVPKPKTSSINLDTENLLVETCHRDGKVSYHVKIPEKFGVVTSMSAQRAFWSHVVALANADLKSNEGDRVRAEELRVLRNWKGKPFEDWVVDFSVYKDHSQCFRNLKAAKHPKQGQSTRPQDYLIPLGKSLQDITEEYWKESLITNVSSKARLLEVPKEWSKTNENTEGKRQAIQMFTSEIHRANTNTEEDVRRVEIDDKQSTMFSSLLKAIGPQWSVANKSLLQVRYGYLNPKVDVLPKYIYLFPRTKYCPIKKGTHDTCCSWLKLSQDGTIIISCFSSNHDGKPSSEIHYHEDKASKEKEAVMIETWGVFKWGKALNSRFAFMKNPPISSKCIVEYYENSIEYHNADHLTNLFANCRAYYYSPNEVSGKKITAKNRQVEQSSDSGKDIQKPVHEQNKDSHVDDNATSTEISKSNQRVDEQQFQKIAEALKENLQHSHRTLKHSNPFKYWLHATYRRDVNRIIFDPNLKDCSGDINTWHGFNVSPKPSDNPCPRLLNHIRAILVSNNEEHYEFLLNWLCWIVQRPGEKTGVAVVFVSDQGTGKSTLVNVLQKIFGIHCLQITNSQHLFTQFSAHMDNRVLIVLNESTWGGDKAHEGWVKAAITDDDSLSQAKFGEIKSIKNYWNLMFVSNQPWCYPASDDNRRFFSPTVSNQRIGDHQYFNDLHGEIDNGGAEELLHFLMTRQIPEGWTSAKFLPNRTKTHFTALMEDRKNSALKWFISKLKQREWKEYVLVSYGTNQERQEQSVTLISWSEPTFVSSAIIQLVWQKACEHNKDLQNHASVRDMKQLKNFFGRLFDDRKELFKACSETMGRTKTRGYEFASMQDIRTFITEFHGFDDWDDIDDVANEDDTPRQTKKHKPSRTQLDNLSQLIKKHHPQMVQYAKQIFGFYDSMDLEESSNHSDKMSVAEAENNEGCQSLNNQYMLSDEELTTQHAILDGISDSGDNRCRNWDMYSRDDD